MSFWTNPNTTPKRNFRFLVEITGFGKDSVIWWAKSSDIPSFDVAETTHQFLDNTYKFPGKVTWSDVNMQLVDPVSPDAVGLTNKIVEQFYTIKKRKTATDKPKTISKTGAQAALGAVIITIYDAEGTDIEKWNLQRAFIKSVKFSQLSYDNDDLRTIDLTFAYDWAVCTTKTGEEATDDQYYKLS